MEVNKNPKSKNIRRKARKSLIKKISELGQAIKNPDFLAILLGVVVIAFCISLLLSIYCRIIGFILTIVLLMSYVSMVIIKKRKTSSTEIFIVCILAILVALGPNYIREEIKVWGEIVKNKFVESDNVHIKTKLFEVTLQNSRSGPVEVSGKKIIKEEKLTSATEEIIQVTTLLINQKIAGNLINNGSFEILLGNKLSRWGHGYYTDRTRQYIPYINFAWVNFLNADIDISIESDKIGQVLKIMHKSETMNHRCGIMEQYIRVTPGKYVLTFWVKALADFEAGGVWFTTTDDWIITDDKGIRRGYSIDKKGPFNWEKNSAEIVIDKNGPITFTIVSLKKGTIYISDIEFIKKRIEGKY